VLLKNFTIRCNPFDEDTKVVIEETIIDEVDSGTKLEVYSFESGLEWKSETSNAKIGSMIMVSLSSSYYEVSNLTVLKEDIERVINVYQQEMEKEGEEPEIEYMEVEEFLGLNDAVINHVLYHAELYGDTSLIDFYKRLNQ